jgi:peptide/nickel transport system permease protein
MTEREPRFTFLRLVLREKTGAFGLTVVAVFFATGVMVGLFPRISGYDAFAISAAKELLPPSLASPFGTDNFGRGILQAVVAAAPIDALVTFSVVGFSLLFGGLFGALAGYAGGRVDELLMRTTDVFLSFPALILAVGISDALGPGAINAMAALMVVSWPTYARLARGDTLAIREQAYIKAAKLNGKGGGYVMRRHIVPNVLPSLIAYASVNTGFVIITFSVLGYLGLGAQPPAVEWGNLVFLGQSYIRTAPWFPLIPGVVILLVAVAFSLLGDSLRDAMDPTLRTR